MDKKNDGLFDKYLVIKCVDDTIVTDCFILRPEKDPAAVIAIQAYAAATSDKRLADELYKWVGKPMRKPLTLNQINIYEEIVWIEFRNFPQAYGWRAGVDDAMRWVRRVYRGMSNPVYGVHYRLWACRPTDEEREAAPWEECE